jgi:hypothetical protein
MSGRLRFRSDAQYAIRDGGSIDLVEAGDDQIGLSSLQQGFVAKPRDADQGHTSGRAAAMPAGASSTTHGSQVLRRGRQGKPQGRVQTIRAHRIRKGFEAAFGNRQVDERLFFLAYSGARADNDNSG